MCADSSLPDRASSRAAPRFCRHYWRRQSLAHRIQHMHSQSNNRASRELSQYLEGLYGYAMALTRRPDKAEDLVQETMVRALAALDRARADSNLKAWLFTILRNAWRNEIKKGSIRLEQSSGGSHAMVDLAPADPAQSPDELYTASTQRQMVIEALNQLPPDAREIIVLREYEELSYQEIAEVLECPIGTVMSRLDRARAKLRVLLKEALRPETEPSR